MGIAGAHRCGRIKMDRMRNGRSEALPEALSREKIYVILKARQSYVKEFAHG